MNRYKFFLILFFIACYFISVGQVIDRYKTFSYSVNEGLLQSTINDIEFDKNNFCWISFPNGIQKFDGQSFSLVPVQQGLPDDKNVFFFKCKSGEILISHIKGISKYDINKNSFTLIYSNPSNDNHPPLFIGEDNGLIYFCRQTGSIVELDSGSYKKIAETKTGFTPEIFNSENSLRVSANILNHQVVFLQHAILFLWDLQNRKFLKKNKANNPIFSFLIQMKSVNEVLYYFQKQQAFFSYNFSTGLTRKIPVPAFNKSNISRCNILKWHDKNLISFNAGLFETGKDISELITQLVNFENLPIGGTSPINIIKEDNFGNLWITTVTEGIKKVINNNYRIKYYGVPQKDKNFAMTIFPDKINNRILVGTARGGLMIFDTMQRLRKNIIKIPGINLPLAINQVIKSKKNEYFLFISGSTLIGKLSSDLSRVTLIPITTTLPAEKSGVNYFGNFLYQNDHEAVVQSQNAIYRLNFFNDSVNEYNFTSFSTHSGFLFQDQIISHANDELIFLDTTDFHVVKKIPFKNTAGVRCFAKGDSGYIYLGTNKGIFKIDSSGKIFEQYNRSTGLPDECIYTITVDKANNIWCSSNKGIIKINPDKSFLQITKEDGLQENEFNTNAMAIANDGEYFYGGVNGGSSFFPVTINPEEQKLNLLITNIQANNQERIFDTAVWKINEITLPYNQNSLAFDFIAMGNNNPGQYIYQYKMKSIDDSWILNKNLQTVRYFLPPGKYIFQIYASRYFDNNALPLKEIAITIQPPFWRTWWFISLVVLLFLSFMTYVIDNYNRHSYLKKVRALEAEKNIQIERERISRDLHDNIGGYANAVLYKTELLKNEHDDLARQHIIKDLRFATKDIITSLRETIWAMKKKDYSAMDCLIRIRNFIQPFISYYPSVLFKIEGEGPEEKFLPHTTALHIVRIVQEAVTNAIKHSSAKNILIISKFNNDNWELSVQDDGCGFDAGALALLQKGNGLENMKKRADDAGFFIEFTSQKDEGTCLKIIV